MAEQLATSNPQKLASKYSTISAEGNASVENTREAVINAGTKGQFNSGNEYGVSKQNFLGNQTTKSGAYRTFAYNAGTGQITYQGGTSPYMTASNAFNEALANTSWNKSLAADIVRANLNALNQLEGYATAWNAGIRDMFTNKNSSNWTKLNTNQVMTSSQLMSSSIQLAQQEYLAGHNGVSQLILKAAQEGARQVLEKVCIAAPMALLAAPLAAGVAGAETVAGAWTAYRVLTNSLTLPAMAVGLMPTGYVNNRLAGATKGTALLQGSVQTGIEILTESLGGFGAGYRGRGLVDGWWDAVDATVKKFTGSELAGELSKAFLSEGMEEVLSNVLNVTVDATLGKALADSGWQQSFDSIVDFAKDSLESFLVAGISAGMPALMTGSARGIKNASTYARAGMTTAQIRAAVKEDAQLELDTLKAYKEMSSEQKGVYQTIVKMTGADTGRRMNDVYKVVTQMNSEQLAKFNDKKTKYDRVAEKLNNILKKGETKNKDKTLDNTEEKTDEVKDQQIKETKEELKTAKEEMEKAKADTEAIYNYFRNTCAEIFTDRAEALGDELTGIGTLANMNSKFLKATREFVAVKNARDQLIKAIPEELIAINNLCKSRGLGTAIEYLNFKYVQLSNEINRLNDEIVKASTSISDAEQAKIDYYNSLKENENGKTETVQSAYKDTRRTDEMEGRLRTSSRTEPEQQTTADTKSEGTAENQEVKVGLSETEIIRELNKGFTKKTQKISDIFENRDLSNVEIPAEYYEENIKQGYGLYYTEYDGECTVIPDYELVSILAITLFTNYMNHSDAYDINNMFNEMSEDYIASKLSMPDTTELAKAVKEELLNRYKLVVVNNQKLADEYGLYEWYELQPVANMTAKPVSDIQEDALESEGVDIVNPSRAKVLSKIYEGHLQLNVFGVDGIIGKNNAIVSNEFINNIAKTVSTISNSDLVVLKSGTPILDPETRKQLRTTDGRNVTLGLAFNGMTIPCNDGCVIVLESDLADNPRKFCSIVAHEVGHALFNDALDEYINNTEDMFSSEIEKSKSRAVIYHNVSYAIQRYFNMSDADSKTADIITRCLLNYFARGYGCEGVEREEIFHLASEVTSELLTNVFDYIPQFYIDIGENEEFLNQCAKDCKVKATEIKEIFKKYTHIVHDSNFSPNMEAINTLTWMKNFRKESKEIIETITNSYIREEIKEEENISNVVNEIAVNGTAKDQATLTPIEKNAPHEEKLPEDEAIKGVIEDIRNNLTNAYNREAEMQYLGGLIKDVFEDEIDPQYTAIYLEVLQQLYKRLGYIYKNGISYNDFVDRLQSELIKYNYDMQSNNRVLSYANILLDAYKNKTTPKALYALKSLMNKCDTAKKKAAMESGVLTSHLCVVDDILDRRAISVNGMYTLMGGTQISVQDAELARSLVGYDAKSGTYIIKRRTGSEMRIDNRDNGAIRHFESRTTAFMYALGLKNIYQRPYLHAMSAGNTISVGQNEAGYFYTEKGNNELSNPNEEIIEKAFSAEEEIELRNPFDFIKYAVCKDGKSYVATSDPNELADNYIIQTSSAINDELVYYASETFKKHPELVGSRYRKLDGSIDYNKFNDYADETMVICQFMSPIELSNFVARYSRNGIYVGNQLYMPAYVTDSDQKAYKVRLVRKAEFDEISAVYSNSGVSPWDEMSFFNPAKLDANAGKDNSPSYRQNVVDARDFIVLPDVERDNCITHGFMVTDPVDGKHISIDKYLEVWDECSEEAKALIKTRLKALRKEMKETYEEDVNGVPVFKVGDTLLKDKYTLNMTDGAALCETQGYNRGKVGKVQFRGELAHCLKGIMHELPVMSMLVDSGITEMTDIFGHTIKIVETDEYGKPRRYEDGPMKDEYKLLKKGIFFESTVKMLKNKRYSEEGNNPKWKPTDADNVFGAWNESELTEEERKLGKKSFTESLKNVHTMINNNGGQYGLPAFREETNYGIRFMERGETFAFNTCERESTFEESMTSMTQVVRAWLIPTENNSEASIAPKMNEVPLQTLLTESINKMEDALDGTNLEQIRKFVGADPKSSQILEYMASIDGPEGMESLFFNTASGDKAIRDAAKEFMNKLQGLKVPIEGNIINATIFPELIAVVQGVEAMQKGLSVNDTAVGTMNAEEIFNPRLATSGEANWKKIKTVVDGEVIYEDKKLPINEVSVIRSPTQQMSDQVVAKAVDIRGKDYRGYFYTTDKTEYLANKHAILLDADVMYHNVNDLLMLRIDADVDGDTARIIQNAYLTQTIKKWLELTADEKMLKFGAYNIIEFTHGKAPATRCTIEELSSALSNCTQGTGIGLSDTYLNAIYTIKGINTMEERYRLAAEFAVAYKLSTDVFKTGYYPEAWKGFIDNIIQKSPVFYDRYIRPRYQEKEGPDNTKFGWTKTEYPQKIRTPYSKASLTWESNAKAGTYQRKCNAEAVFRNIGNFITKVKSDVAVAKDLWMCGSVGEGATAVTPRLLDGKTVWNYIRSEYAYANNLEPMEVSLKDISDEDKVEYAYGFACLYKEEHPDTDMFGIATETGLKKGYLQYNSEDSVAYNALVDSVLNRRAAREYLRETRDEKLNKTQVNDIYEKHTLPYVGRKQDGTPRRYAKITSQDAWFSKDKFGNPYFNKKTWHYDQLANHAFAGFTEYGLDQYDNKWYTKAASHGVTDTSAELLAAIMTGYETIDEYRARMFSMLACKSIEDPIYKSFRDSMVLLGRVMIEYDKGSIDGTRYDNAVATLLSPFIKYNINSYDVCNAIIAESYLLYNASKHSKKSAELSRKEGWANDSYNESIITDKVYPNWKVIGSFFIDVIKANVEGKDCELPLGAEIRALKNAGIKVDVDFNNFPNWTYYNYEDTLDVISARKVEDKRKQTLFSAKHPGESKTVNFDLNKVDWNNVPDWTDDFDEIDEEVYKESKVRKVSKEEIASWFKKAPGVYAEATGEPYINPIDEIEAEQVKSEPAKEESKESPSAEDDGYLASLTNEEAPPETENVQPEPETTAEPESVETTEEKDVSFKRVNADDVKVADRLHESLKGKDKIDSETFKGEFDRDTAVEEFNFTDRNGKKRTVKLTSANKYFAGAAAKFGDKHGDTVDDYGRDYTEKNFDVIDNVYVPKHANSSLNHDDEGTFGDYRNNIMRFTWTHASEMSVEELYDFIDKCGMILDSTDDIWKDSLASKYILKAKKAAEMAVRGKRAGSAENEFKFRKDATIAIRKATERWEFVTKSKITSQHIQEASMADLLEAQPNLRKFINKFFKKLKLNGTKVEKTADKAVSWLDGFQFEMCNMQTLWKSISGFKGKGVGYVMSKTLDKCSMNKAKYSSLCYNSFTKKTIDGMNKASDRVKMATTMAMYLDMCGEWDSYENDDDTPYDKGLVIDKEGNYLQVGGRTLTGKDLYDYMVEESKLAYQPFIKEWYEFARTISPMLRQAYYNSTGVQIENDDMWRDLYFPVFKFSEGRIQDFNSGKLESYTRFYNPNAIHDSRALYCVGANTIAQSYIDQMCTYMAYSEYDQMTAYIFNENIAPPKHTAHNQSIQASLNNVYGNKQITKIFQNYARQIQTIDRQDGLESATIITQLMRNAQTGAIPLNPRVWCTQIASIEIAAAFGLPRKALWKNLEKNVRRCTGAQENVDKIIAEMPESVQFIFETRWANQQIDPNYLQSYQGNDSLAGKLTNAVGEGTNKLWDKLTNGKHQFRANLQVNVMDMCTVMAKEQTLREIWIKSGKDVNTEAYANAVYELINQGDPCSDRHCRSEVQRTENALKKATLGMWQTQPEQNRSLGITKRIEKDVIGTDKANKDYIRTRTALMTSKLAFASITVLFNVLLGKMDFSDKDKDGVDPIKVLWTITGTTINQTSNVIAKPIISRILASIDDNFYASDITVGPLDNITKALDSITRFCENPSAKTCKSAAVKIGAVCGLPVSIAYDILNAVVSPILGDDITQYIDTAVENKEYAKENGDAKAFVKEHKTDLDADGNGHVKAAEIEAYANANPDYQDILREYWSEKFKSNCPF